jgi:hypothetical protein
LDPIARTIAAPLDHSIHCEPTVPHGELHSELAEMDDAGLDIEAIQEQLRLLGHDIPDSLLVAYLEQLELDGSWLDAQAEEEPGEPLRPSRRSACSARHEFITAPPQRGAPSAQDIPSRAAGNDDAPPARAAEEAAEAAQAQEGSGISSPELPASHHDVSSTRARETSATAGSSAPHTAPRTPRK